MLFYKVLEILGCMFAVALFGNYLYYFLTAKPSRTPEPSKPSASESVWYDGDE